MAIGGNSMNKFSEFVDGFVPKNVSKKRRAELKMELENHLYDKSDYYKEIGFSEEESIEKALEDFGTDEEMKNNIFNEFEELYSEKTVFSIISFIAIIAMNWICIFTDAWVTSADYNDDPNVFTSLISFSMIFAVCVMIIFARVKRYRKTLVAIGAANFLIGAIFLWDFYPQCAAYSMVYNVIYLIDTLTPFSTGDLICNGNYGIPPMVLWISLPLVFALYCVIAAIKIKKGSEKTITDARKKFKIFSSVYIVVAILTVFLLPLSSVYIDDYRVWFEDFDNFMSEESEAVFETISLGDSYNEVSSRLVSSGYTTIEEYQKTLDRIELKQFKRNVKEFNVAENYEMWFKVENRPDGNGFIGIKQEYGIITGKGVGSLEQEAYFVDNVGGRPSFGYSNIEFYHDMLTMVDYFRSLKKGASEFDVLTAFSNNLGFVYTKRFSIENGVEKHYYRIYSYGEINMDKKDWWGRRDSRCIELTFENGYLTDGALYDIVYENKKHKLITEEIGY